MDTDMDVGAGMGVGVGVFVASNRDDHNERDGRANTSGLPSRST